MSRARPLPGVLQRLLRYEPETGKLYWRPREPSQFSESRYSADRLCRSWNTRFAGKEAFTARTSFGHLHGHVDWFKESAHRVIWALVHGSWPEQGIDHINGDPSDNRIVNLRLASQTDNMRNARRPTTNTSGIMGVRWRKDTNKWTARFRADGRTKNLGCFVELSEAAAVVQAARLEYGYHPNHGRG